MRHFILKAIPLCAGILLLVTGCRKQGIFDGQTPGSALTASQNVVHPLTPTTYIGVSVYYDPSGSGTVFVSWSGDGGGPWKLSISGVSGTILTSGNEYSIQHHFNGNTTITATVTSVDGTISGTGSCYIDANGHPTGQIYNPLSPFSNMEITSNLGGCTVNLTWPLGNPFIQTAYFYLELRSPVPAGSDGEWLNSIVGQCSSTAGYISLHINRYYYNDPIIDARLVIQNTPFIPGTTPVMPNGAGDARFNLFFHLPWTAYHFSGTLNQFTNNF